MFALAVSVDVLVLAIAVGCMVASVIANRRFRPMAAVGLATVMNLVLCILIYSAPRLANEGWRGFADDLSHPFAWTVALAIGAFFAGTVTLVFVALRRLRRAP